MYNSLFGVGMGINMHKALETAETLDVPKYEQLENIWENKHLMHTILNALKDGITFSDESGHFWIFNSAMEKLTGYTQEEANSCSDFTMLLYPNHKDRQHALDGINNIVNQEDSIYETETVIYTKDGIKRNILVSTTLIPYGNRKMFLSAYHDITERKKAEEKFKILFDSSRDAIMTLDPPSWKFTSANPSTIKLFKAKDELEFISKGPWDVSPEFQPDGTSSLDKAKRMIEKAMKEGSNFFEWMHKTLDGKEFLCTVLLTRVEIEKNKPFLQATVRDISEQKKMQEQYKILFNSSPDSILLLDEDGKILSANFAMAKSLGVSTEELIGKNINKFLPRDVYKKRFTFARKALETGEIQEEDDERDGRFFHNIFIPIFTPDGTKSVQVIARDITDIKVSELLLKESEEKFRTISSSAQDGIIMMDNDGNVTFWNRAAEKMFGYSSDEIIGKNLHMLIAPETLREGYKKAFSSFKDKGKGAAIGKTLELSALRRDGTEFPVELSLSSVKIKGKWNAIGIIRDITERKKAEEKIKRQNIQLKKLDKIKSNFLNITSHELRTPMSSIKGYVQMLLKGLLGEITEEQKRGLNVVLRNVDRLDHLIQDILDVSRLESGSMKFIPEETDIKKMIKETIETMQSNADQKNITINSEIAEIPQTLIIDRQRIKQVIINLINNAIKFSPDGSVINIRVRQDNDMILFEIEDFGRGIPKNKQNKIFDTFYQVDSGMDRKFGGAGLGLAISRGIILSHGGKIWVDSTGKSGEGSIFKFSLPIKPVQDIEKRFREIDIFGLEEKNDEEKEKDLKNGPMYDNGMEREKT